MRRCLSLAKLGSGRVSPNPMVGAVLVYDNMIIGEGYHQAYGHPHAEVNCLESVSEENKCLINKSTLYVSLEPCSHFGKTPPCTDLIIKYQVPKVIIGCRDIYKEVNGMGIEKLKNDGVMFEEDVLKNECSELNKRFFTRHGKLRPYIILKWSESRNGMMAGGKDTRTFISNEFSNRLVHKWRSEESAILVGANTAIKDNPSLTVRLWPGMNPVRVVIDPQLRLPGSLKIFDGSVRTIIFNCIKEEPGDMISYYKAAPLNMVHTIVNGLYNLDIESVMIEGGAATLNFFLEEGLWDEARIIQNTSLVVNNGLKAPALAGAVMIDKEVLGTDLVYYYINPHL